MVFNSDVQCCNWCHSWSCKTAYNYDIVKIKIYSYKQCQAYCHWNQKNWNISILSDAVCDYFTYDALKTKL